MMIFSDLPSSYVASWADSTWSSNLDPRRTIFLATPATSVLPSMAALRASFSRCKCWATISWLERFLSFIRMSPSLLEVSEAAAKERAEAMAIERKSMIDIVL